MTSEAKMGGFGRGFVLFLFSFLFYIATLSFHYPYDGVVWAMLLERQAVLGDLLYASPHYLAYFTLVEPLYMLVGPLLNLRSLPFLQVWSALAAGLAVALFDLLLRRAYFGSAARAVGIAAFALAPYFWQFATTPEVYTTSAVFLLTAFLLSVSPAGFGRRVSAILLPVLGHQSLAMFGPASMIAIRREDGRWRPAVTVAAVAAVIFLVLAVGAWATNPDGHGALPRFILGHVGPGQGEGAQKHFGGVERALRAATLRPPGELSTVLPVGWIMVGLGLAGLLRPPDAARPIARLAAWFLLFDFAFNLSWDALGNDFWVFITLPLAFGLASLAEQKRIGALVLAVLVAANAAVTYTRAVLPAQKSSSNASLQRAHRIGLDTTRRDVLLIPGFGGTGSDKVYLPYFEGRLTLYADWILSEPGTVDERLDRLDRRIQAVGPGVRMLMTREMTEDVLVLEHFEADYGIPRERWMGFVEARRGRKAGELLYEVVTPAGDTGAR